MSIDNVFVAEGALAVFDIISELPDSAVNKLLKVIAPHLRSVIDALPGDEKEEFITNYLLTDGELVDRIEALEEKIAEMELSLKDIDVADIENDPDLKKKQSIIAGLKGKLASIIEWKGCKIEDLDTDPETED